MGNFSDKVKVTDVEAEEEKKIQKYEQEIEKNPYGYGFQEEGDKTVIKWWQWLIYDMKYRILYAIILGVLIGLVIPILVNVLLDPKKDRVTIYGSCLINNEARIQCLINSLNATTEDECMEANCCWENDDELLYKCYHSFPSAYQYVLQSANNDEDTNSSYLIATPIHKDIMKTAKVHMEWTTNKILSLEIYDPDKFPDKNPTTPNMNSTGLFKSYEGDDLSVLHGSEKNYFYIQVERKSSKQTIFDTRLGPIHIHENFTTFSTILPTKYVYGLKGGQSMISKDPVTYGVVNGFENAELPFYMVLEESGDWHAVLLETSYPFMVQFVNIPGLMFHIEGSRVSANLKFFVGPSKNDVLLQLNNYLYEKEGKAGPSMPPYWGLGLHLCRRLENGNDTMDHINSTAFEKIPYDSDCIDENLRGPFEVDDYKFSNWDEILSFLTEEKSRRIVLSQNLALPLENYPDEKIAKDLLIQRASGAPFKGYIDNITMVYPNLLNENWSPWFEAEFNRNELLSESEGMILTDNFPKNEIFSEAENCTKLQTKLGSLFVNATSKYTGETWISLCPDLVHRINSNISKIHSDVHNTYGHEALVQIAKILNTTSRKERFLLAGASPWTESFLYGGYTGMEVPFTWEGLKDSLAQIIRHFILFPFTGTPICGSHVPNNTNTFDKDLCLRWFQLGLILPFARNTYGVGSISRGPLDFTPIYQNYLVNTIKERYSFIPYYYTLFQEYQTTFIPPVRPMSFEFNTPGERNITFGLSDQFMIGSALMAAPILTRSVIRDTYFPKGSWYEVNGNEVWSNDATGGEKSVTGHITQTPLFVRGGYIIPFLQSMGANTAEESRNGTYTILIAPSLSSGSNLTAEGFLYMDDGVTNEENPEHDAINFQYFRADDSSKHTISFVSTSCFSDDSISKRITQVKIFRFSIPDGKNVTIGLPGASNPPTHLYDDDILVLRVSGLNINWCDNTTMTITFT